MANPRHEPIKEISTVTDIEGAFDDSFDRKVSGDEVQAQTQTSPVGRRKRPLGSKELDNQSRSRTISAVPMLGGLLFGIGMIAALLCIQNYLTDAFGAYAASALAANTLLRSIVGGLLPLMGLKMYASLGLGWGDSLIGFLSLAMIPIRLRFTSMVRLSGRNIQ
ncbi:hypothetical protein MBLNU457_5309t1 [Dothideomycetes sp. NU457]